MSCWDTLTTYGLRSIGIGPRALPSADITLCDQFVLIGSGMIWNVYFGIIAVIFGFVAAVALAVAKDSRNLWVQKPAAWFIFIFRGSPLFIQFFFCYFLFLSLRGWVPQLGFLTSAVYGALVVLFMNTAAYSAEIFLGALRAIPKGDVEAADAYGFSGFSRFRRIIFPNMLRLAWPSYTNEAIFLFHATTLVFFSGFPAVQQQGDALYYASYLAGKTFNPFISYPILAGYFILLTLLITLIMGVVNKRLNRHLPQERRSRIKLRLRLIR
ncbi:ABC transporter permease subunit [Ketogulonicigenium vulgare]|uniref:His/Glu/Gln/Arg/opine family ABC transporter, permease protein n=1 Tax=Ketogulonicigenium vulgare (strain WSH-001) TaxID=759362 RepID=F9Y9F1_KETVW|nr:ABC transporter permease subunit [Ketogulonicigenium vulgare]ADO41909.1 His/Glu/Gln/Arg/opine family ABC transporter, permease protein [Ketogulonicigenium vulgare Y25]AEM40133.1 His/Glu/Gln/Arg/opine family ABC transporter, permease protein [Ketogulonicigenium vulgare WSH-001]ALJ80339.1 amino acid ABC transporter permease [Ketogulonicigenium vulgare]ANW33176.1 amino acid ABC transporter permease [Ketogulonicigenium vulgare]AOZ53832.1 His/Glu/Gln/Arg/opine family ABC transporter permease [Ke